MAFLHERYKKFRPYAVLLCFLIVPRYDHHGGYNCKPPLDYYEKRLQISDLRISSHNFKNQSGMVPPYVRFREAFLISPDYNLATCQIEKIMSTFRSAMFCYLNRKDEFVAAGRSISTEHWLTACVTRK
ncbi:hypothetical protein GCK32_007416 [Trichostrongylus colubriformis]|uniref:Uncharacterized protein n=1 Tax=Trichostrongylus colubriformis TaxID=6319 RepID=A0AAN8FJW7_TRICO